MKTTQKIIRIGTSAGITIPKEDLAKRGASIGDKITVSWDIDKSNETSDLEVIQAARKILAKYSQDFKNLADR